MEIKNLTVCPRCNAKTDIVAYLPSSEEIAVEVSCSDDCCSSVYCAGLGVENFVEYEGTES